MRTYVRTLLAVAALTLSMAPGLSRAQGAPSNTTTCDLLAKGYQQDQYQFGSDKTRFLELQSMISDDRYSDYSAAGTSNSTFGVSIIDIVDLFLGGQSTSQNWGTRWASFKALQYENINWTSQTSIMVKTTQASIIQSIANCATTLAGLSQTGLFAYYDGLTPSLDNFALHIVKRSGTGTSVWYLRGLDIGAEGTPVSCKAGGTEYANIVIPVDAPLKMDASVPFICTKNSMVHLTLVISSDQGNVQTISIPGTEELNKSFDDRITTLESAVIPDGMIAFIKSNVCPVGWTEDTDLRGRYVVGLQPTGTPGTSVGQALSDGENRATGSHTHSTGGTLTGGCCGIQTGSDNDSDHVVGTQSSDAVYTKSDGTAATPIAGTNAPYLSLLACQKLPTHVEATSGAVFDQSVATAQVTMHALIERRMVKSRSVHGKPVAAKHAASAPAH